MRSFVRSLIILAITGAILATILLPLLLIPRVAGFIGDGDYELTIYLKSTSKTPVRKIDVYLCLDLSEANRKAADPTRSYLSDFPWSPPGKTFDSKVQKITFLAPFTVSNKRDLFGRIYDERDWQFEGILLAGTLENGRHFQVAAEIPSRHLMDAIEVTIP